MLAGALGLAAVGRLRRRRSIGGVGRRRRCWPVAVNFAAAVGRLAFESIVQRDAPQANRGRAFAQFETRFQLAWALAGLIPVVIVIPGWVGFLVVGWSPPRRSSTTSPASVGDARVPPAVTGRPPLPADAVRRSSAAVPPPAADARRRDGQARRARCGPARGRARRPRPASGWRRRR